VKVVMRNPRRDVELDPPPASVAALLAELGVVAESVLVIRNDELVTRDARLDPADVVEIRPVVSGGAR
jgi:sulfur carrier protein ThiS